MSAEETTMIETKDGEERGEWRFETLKPGKLNKISHCKNNFDIVDNPDEILNLLKPGKNDDTIGICIKYVLKSDNSTLINHSKYNICYVKFYRTMVCEDSNVAEFKSRIWGKTYTRFDCIRLEDKFYVVSDNKNDKIKYRGVIDFLNDALGLNRDVVKSAAKR